MKKLLLIFACFAFIVNAQTNTTGFGQQNLYITPRYWHKLGSNLFYDAGNVGIGTTSPGSALQVGGLDDGFNYDITLGWNAVGNEAVGTKRSALTFRTAQISVNDGDIYKWDIAMLAAEPTVAGEEFGSDLAFLRTSRDLGENEDVTMILTRTGNVGIGTTDLDGTPAIGRLTIKGSTNDGSTNIVVGRDSDEGNVFYIDTDGNAYFESDVSALTFTDRTPYYDGDALTELGKIKADTNGEIDHKTLPSFMKSIVTRDIFKDTLITKKRQKIVTKTDTTKIEKVVKIGDKWVKTVKDTVIETEEPLFDSLFVYDENDKQLFNKDGSPVIHTVPILEDYQELITKKIGDKEVTERNLGNTISMLIKAVKQLEDEIKQLKTQ